MKDEKTKIRFLMVGIAVVLIIIIAGISVVMGMSKNETDYSSKLQTEIINYADDTQSKDRLDQQPETESETADPKDSQEDEQKAETAKVEDQATIIEAPKEQPAPVEEPVAVEIPPVQQPKDTATTTQWHVESTEKLDQVEIDLPRQMSEMKGYWEAGNMDAIKDLAYLPRYRAASAKLKDTTKYYYFGDIDDKNRPNGKGLAMYADNQYYYGDWQNGVRSGSGMWIRYYVYNEKALAADSLYALHSYSGNWLSDLPNGEGAEHYDFMEGNLVPGVGYNRNFIGNFKDGLYDGEIYITNYYSEAGGNVKEWTGTAKAGVWQPMGQKDKQGQYPIIVEKTNKDNYQWMKQSDNKNQGITDLISAARSVQE